MIPPGEGEVPVAVSGWVYCVQGHIKNKYSKKMNEGDAGLSPLNTEGFEHAEESCFFSGHLLVLLLFRFALRFKKLSVLMSVGFLSKCPHEW